MCICIHACMCVCMRVCTRCLQTRKASSFHTAKTTVQKKKTYGGHHSRLSVSIGHEIPNLPHRNEYHAQPPDGYFVIGKPLFAPRYPLCVLHVRVFLDVERDLRGMQPRHANYATHATHATRARASLDASACCIEARRKVWGRAAGVFNSGRSCQRNCDALCYGTDTAISKLAKMARPMPNHVMGSY